MAATADAAYAAAACCAAAAVAAYEKSNKKKLCALLRAHQCRPLYACMHDPMYCQCVRMCVCECLPMCIAYFGMAANVDVDSGAGVASPRLVFCLLRLQCCTHFRLAALPPVPALFTAPLSIHFCLATAFFVAVAAAAVAVGMAYVQLFWGGLYAPHFGAIPTEAHSTHTHTHTEHTHTQSAHSLALPPIRQNALLQPALAFVCDRMRLYACLYACMCMCVCVYFVFVPWCACAFLGVRFCEIFGIYLLCTQTATATAAATAAAAA